MTSDVALLAIQELMDGCACDDRTLEQIAAILQEAGYRIRDRHDRDVAWPRIPAHPLLPVADADRREEWAIDAAMAERAAPPPATPTRAPRWDRPEIAWAYGLQPIGPDAMPWAKLNGTLTIAGVDHYVEAYAVQDVPVADGETTQEAVLLSGSSHFDELSEIVQSPMQTVEIHGRPYVFLITPFSA